MKKHQEFVSLSEIENAREEAYFEDLIRTVYDDPDFQKTLEYLKNLAKRHEFWYLAGEIAVIISLLTIIVTLFIYTGRSSEMTPSTFLFIFSLLCILVLGYVAGIKHEKYSDQTNQEAESIAFLLEKLGIKDPGYLSKRIFLAQITPKIIEIEQTILRERDTAMLKRLESGISQFGDDGEITDIEAYNDSESQYSDRHNK